jgi:glycosyltransferase involved in cell wall biosynthesis
VGRIVPIKNHIDFLKIVAVILKKGFTNVKFFVIGDGNGRGEMLEFLKQANIAYSLPEEKMKNAPVIFTSWIANMYEAIYDVDAVVLTSFNEGTPVSLIEAQLCAKPVVAYNVGGVKDTFINNQSGFLINKGDISTFANQLIKLIENKELRMEMGAAGKAYASKKFSKHTEVALVDELYTKLLQKPK